MTSDRPQPMPGVVAVVLAAGSATRFGATKQLAELDGRPLVAHAVGIARAAGIDRVLLVVGHDADDVVHAAGDVEVVPNPDHRDGQATSVAAGLRAASRHADAHVAVVLLADQPGVDPGAVRTVVAALGEPVTPDGAGRHDAARVRYTDGPGHPVAFARHAWERVCAAVTGDAGARTLFHELDTVPVEVDGPAPRDVDAPTDLAALRAERPDGGDAGAR